MSGICQKYLLKKMLEVFFTAKALILPTNISVFDNKVGQRKKSA